MNYRVIFFLYLLLQITLVNEVSAKNIGNTFDDENNTLILKDQATNMVLLTVKQISVKPDLVSMEEVFNITSYEDYTFNNNKDFKVRWQKFKGKNDITNTKWEILENVEYNITVPDYLEVEKNLTISNIQSYTDVTDIYDSNPWRLESGEINAKKKWNITSTSGVVTIGFENYKVNTNPLNITFSWNVTEQISTHEEARYRDEWKPFFPDGKILKKGESYTVKLTLFKQAEKGSFSIKTIPKFAGVEEDRMTWWNSSWSYRIDNLIPNGVRPYQLVLKSSNSAGSNNATHVFLNGNAKPDFTDIRFTLDNTTALPYWIENSTGKVWVNVTANGIVNMYYGNPSATDSSDGKSTFEFFDDFARLDLGSNPVISPSVSWEFPNLRWGSFAYLDGTYYIYYTNGSSPTSGIGRATSPDLINWTKYSNNPVIINSIGPSLLKELDGETPVFYNNKYWMLTMKSDGSAIQLRSAPSLNSNTWTIENGNLIPKVPGTWYGNLLYTTSFVMENGNYYISMEARNNSLKWNIGLFKASSPLGPYIDRGVLLSPTLPWEYGGAYDPEMRKFDNTYYLFYTAGINKSNYQNSYATSSNLEGLYTKSQIKITPISISYPAILYKYGYYYILTDDHTPLKGNGKNLYKRKNLNGIFGTPFDWYKSGNPATSGSELIIDADGEYIRSTTAFKYKALKIRAKFAPLADDNSIQYFGFAASSNGGVANSEMIASYDTSPNLKVLSGNTTNYQTTGISNTDYFGSYHDYEILWRNGETKFIIDGTLKDTQTTYVADTPQPIGIYNYGTNASLFVDWVFVRSYVSPEPVWSVWSTEQASLSGGAPSITGLPDSPVANIAGDSRTFTITSNQTVDVKWYINGTPIQSNAGVRSATYTNTSAAQGIWIVRATATNSNGAASKEWRWNVSPRSQSSGLSAHWKLDENTGTTASDSSGNANTGLIYGPVWTTGKKGSALQFDGINDYIDISKSATMAGYQQATIEAWIYLPSSPSAKSPIYSETTSSSSFRRIMLYVLPSRKIELDFRNSNGDPAGSVSAVISNTAIDLNKWYHVAGIFNSVTGMHQIYINGAIDVNINIPTSKLGNSITSGIEIGHLQGTATSYFKGAIDDVKIYNRALTPQEIAAEYSGSGAPPDTNPPVISGISSTDITSSSAIITWTTDEPGDSQIEYGLTSSYGTQTTFNPALVTNHAQTLTGLINSTIYHYRVKSKDASNNLAVSPDNDFTTHATFSSGLSAHWSLDENTGTTASDSSGNANTGILYGPSWTTGKMGSALQFDGLNDYVGIPISATMAGYQQATIEAWVYLTSSPSVRAPIYSETTSSSSFRRIMLFVLPSRKIELDFRNSNGDPAGSVSAVISNTAIDLNKWYHVAGIFNSVTGMHQIYINGTIDVNTNIPTSALGTSSTKGIRIGHLQGTTTSYFKGTIDEVKIYNRALTAQEIAAEYH